MSDNKTTTEEKRIAADILIAGLSKGLLLSYDQQQTDEEIKHLTGLYVAILKNVSAP